MISIHWVTYLCYYLVAYSHSLAGGDVHEKSLRKDESIDCFLDIDVGFHCCGAASGARMRAVYQ